MEITEQTTVQVMVTLEGGLVRDLQVFKSEASAQRFWDSSIKEAKKHVKYQKLSQEEQEDFDMDPFGFAYDGAMELVWEQATIRE